MNRAAFYTYLKKGFRQDLPGRRHFLLALILVCLPIAAPADSKLEGDFDRFPTEITVGQTTLQRKGVGRMRRWMITGADVALYVPEGTARADILTGGPFALSFYYYTRIRGEQFTTAGWEILRHNVSADVLEEQSANIEKMGTFLTDVGRGDRYLLLFDPDRGTTLKRNGKKVGTIEDDRFAAVYFQIWLGRHPIDERMHNALITALPETG